MYQDGYFDLENINQILDVMIRSKADIVFSVISTNKKEPFIEKHRNRFSNFLCFPIEGEIDNEAGLTEFSPKLFIICTEWIKCKIYFVLFKRVLSH